MPRLKILAAAACLLLSTPALPQTTVRQSGTVTAQHLPYWVTSGVIGDGGSATDSPITSIGVTNNGGAGICVASDRQSAAGRNQLCFGAQTAGAATISLQNYGTAAAQTLNFVLNGVTSTLGFTAGNPQVGDLAFFQTAQVLADSGIAASNGIISAGAWAGTPIAVIHGGTGGTTAAVARTNLGLGTISTQDSANVDITGGAITGIPSPTNPSDVAIKSYVDANASGLNILAQSTLATAAVLPNTPSYSNGASGVGATLTAGSNSTLTVDGTIANLSDVVLVNNQAAALQNGIYTVTTAGSGGAPWVLTRATYFDSPAEMTVGSYTFITAGATNINTSWVLSTTTASVGVTAVNFNKFSSVGTVVTQLNQQTGALVMLPYPQGRLTLTSGTPVVATSVAAATTVYYTAYAGKNIPIYNGTAVAAYQLCVAGTAGACESSVALGSNWAGNSNYDFFETLSGGLPVLCTGPAWTSATGRGSGAGTTQLQQFDGINTNAVTMTCRTGNATTISVAANQGTFVGTMRTGAAGQTNFIFGASAPGGTAGNFGIWNAYNKVTIKTTVNDSNQNWPYVSTTPRPADNSTGNSVSFISGLAEDGFSCNYANRLQVAALSFFTIGCSLDSTSTFDRKNLAFNGAASTTHFPMSVKNDYNPVLGWHTVQAIEAGDGTNNNPSSGSTDEAFMFEFSM